jgi:hypothetical protein
MLSSLLSQIVLARGSALAGRMVCHDGGDVEVCEPATQNPCSLRDPVGCDPHPEQDTLDWHLLKNQEPYPGGAYPRARMHRYATHSPPAPRPSAFCVPIALRRDAPVP